MLHALAGTVALPSPRPATGRIFLGLTRRPEFTESILSVLPELYLKSVERVNDSLEITRIISLTDLRAVELPSLRDDAGRPAMFRILTVDDSEIARSIAEARLTLGHRDGGREIELFEQAVLHVPETAPVYVRVVREFGVTAAMAAENVENAGGNMPCQTPRTLCWQTC